MNRSRQWKVEVRHEWTRHPDADGWEPLTEQQAVLAGLKKRRRGQLNYMVPRSLVECIELLRFYARDDSPYMRAGYARKDSPNVRIGSLRLKNVRDGETIPFEALGL